MVLLSKSLSYTISSFFVSLSPILYTLHVLSCFALSRRQQEGKLKEAAKVGKDEEFLHSIFSLACEKTSAILAKSPIDVYVSGTTFTGFVCTERKCWTINVGDSRVVGCSKNGAVYKAIDLTVDQNPDRPDEQARILATGGRVFDWGVPRVWLADVDMPGLAMSRSFGDLAAESVGVFSQPEVRAFEIDRDTAFIIVASDGVWEFISSQEAVDLVAAFHANGQSPQEACTALVNESLRLWNEEEDVVDDITAVIVYNMDYGDQLSKFSLDGNSSPASPGLLVRDESMRSVSEDVLPEAKGTNINAETNVPPVFDVAATATNKDDSKEKI